MHGPGSRDADGARSAGTPHPHGDLQGRYKENPQHLRLKLQWISSLMFLFFGGEGGLLARRIIFRLAPSPWPENLVCAFYRGIIFYPLHPNEKKHRSQGTCRQFDFLHTRKKRGGGLK